MTYHDPERRDMPERREVLEVREVRDSDGMGGVAMALIAVAFVAVIGFMAWALTSGRETTALNTAPPAAERTIPAPPATTGQGERRAPPPAAK